MIVKVFSILDVKADCFVNLFTFSTNGQAVRAFKDLVNDERSTISRHPSDYRLTCVGTFDDSAGVLSPLVVPESLGFGSDYVDPPGGVVPVGVSGSVPVPMKGLRDGSVQ